MLLGCFTVGGKVLTFVVLVNQVCSDKRDWEWHLLFAMQCLLNTKNAPQHSHCFWIHNDSAACPSEPMWEKQQEILRRIHCERRGTLMTFLKSQQTQNWRQYISQDEKKWDNTRRRHVEDVKRGSGDEAWLAVNVLKTKNRWSLMWKFINLWMLQRFLYSLCCLRSSKHISKDSQVCQGLPCI